MYTNYPEPDYPAALGLISHLNAEELKELLNNDSKFEELIKDMKQFKDLETEKDMIMASNRSLAEFNLSKEPQLQEGKHRLQELSSRGEALCQSVESKVSDLKQRSGDMSLDTTLALLQTSAAETEEESEAFADKFLEGDLEIDGFLDQFVSKRRTMHLRRVKAEKMAELLTTHVRSPVHGPMSPPQAMTHHAIPSYFPLPPVSGSIPYPVGGMHMPMPGAYGANVF